jgi:hypothetical protein
VACPLPSALCPLPFALQRPLVPKKIPRPERFLTAAGQTNSRRPAELPGGFRHVPVPGRARTPHTSRCTERPTAMCAAAGHRQCPKKPFRCTDREQWLDVAADARSATPERKLPACRSRRRKFTRTSLPQGTDCAARDAVARTRRSHGNGSSSKELNQKREASVGSALKQRKSHRAFHGIAIAR